MPVPQKVSVSELKEGELEIILCSIFTKLYECGHKGPNAFKLSMGDYKLLSPLIEQDKMCPKCVLESVCNNLVRCPLCGKVYEAIPEDVAISSLHHFLQCFPKHCLKTAYYL